jgi:virulence factor Mce-like protein
MRRAIGIGAVIVAAAALWLVASGAGGDTGGKHYWVTLDNAFGLVDGADVKVAGVRAGKISGFKLDRKSYHALVEVEIDQQGFDRFRSDAFCESRPQSLIGEYFIDCQPGARGRLLKDGGTIPVSNTATTVAPDLVSNILRLPERQRLRNLLNELGAAVAGNGRNLNQAIRRAVPALRNTDRVLAILAQQNKVLADLARNGDEVVTALADNHENVGRWVLAARDTAAASASRQVALAATWHKLPAFLAELRPTMAALGQAAADQTPALRNLDQSSTQLTRFFNDLGPFAEASRPSFRSLGDASTIGRQAARSATPTIAELNRFASSTPELSKNLRIVLEHLDDPAYGAESDKRAIPQHTDGRDSYTGLEALLQYIFDQGQSVNLFDGIQYILKVSPFLDEKCSPYTDAKPLAKPDPAAIELYLRCSGNKIGPKGPGLLGDPTISDNGRQYPGESASSTSTRSHGGHRRRAQSQDGGHGSSGGGGEKRSGSSGGGGPAPPPNPVDPVSAIVKAITQGKLPNVNVPNLPGVPVDPKGIVPRGGKGSDDQLLGYLMSP